MRGLLLSVFCVCFAIAVCSADKLVLRAVVVNLGEAVAYTCVLMAVCVVRRHDQAHEHLDRGGERHAALAALVHVVLRLFELIAHELQRALRDPHPLHRADAAPEYTHSLSRL